jgi:hypothetical protein
VKTFPGMAIGAIILLSACSNSGTGQQKDSIAAENNKDSIIISKIDTANTKDGDSTGTLLVNEPGKELLLHFNLEKGRSYAYDIALEIGQEIQERKMNTGMNWKYTLQVLNDNKSLKTIRVTYNRIAMSMNMESQKMEFNSDGPVGDPTNPLNMAGNLFSAMKGKSFTMKVDTNGEIKEVDGMDKLGEELVAGMQVPDEMKEKLLQSFRAKFNENDVKETFSQTFSVLPNKKVKVGDSWNRESLIRVGPAKGKMLTVYRVSSINSNIAKLTGKGTIRSESGKVTGSQNSNLLIDVPTGLVLENVFDMSTEGQDKWQTHGRITGKKL